MNESFSQYDMNTLWIIAGLTILLIAIMSFILLLISGRLSNFMVRQIEKREDKKILEVAEGFHRDPNKVS